MLSFIGNTVIILHLRLKKLPINKIINVQLNVNNHFNKTHFFLLKFENLSSVQLV